MQIPGNNDGLSGASERQASESGQDVQGNLVGATIMTGATAVLLAVTTTIAAYARLEDSRQPQPPAKKAVSTEKQKSPGTQRRLIEP